LRLPRSSVKPNRQIELRTTSKIKGNLDFLAFLRRGLRAAQSERALIFACFDLMKLFRVRIAAGAAQ
jgi:hypothetical protein